MGVIAFRLAWPSPTLYIARATRSVRIGLSSRGNAIPLLTSNRTSSPTFAEKVDGIIQVSCADAEAAMPRDEHTREDSHFALAALVLSSTTISSNGLSPVFSGRCWPPGSHAVAPAFEVLVHGLTVVQREPPLAVA